MESKGSLRQTLVSEGVLLAASSGSAYLAGYLFWANYSLYFGIPLTWVALSPSDVLPLGFVLFWAAQLLFVPVIWPKAEPISAEPKPPKQIAVSVKLRTATLFALYLAVILGTSSFWQSYFVTIPAAILSLAASCRAILWLRDREKYREWLQVADVGITGEPMALFLAVVGPYTYTAFLVGAFMLGLAGFFGNMYARVKADYMIVASAPQVVLARFGDDLIAAQFIPKNRLICPSLRIIRIEGSNTPVLSAERVGPLRPTYWAPFQPPIYPPDCPKAGQ